MLEGPGSRTRLSRLQRDFRRHGPRRVPGIRARPLGLVAFGIFLGAGTVTLLDANDPQKAFAFRPAYYGNCGQARAAGVAPIYRGQPGYAPHLDADDDGIACEPYPRRWR